MTDGSPIRCGPGETLQQTIDQFAPARVAAMLEVLSPQVATAAATSSYVSTIVTPTMVTMHTIEPSLSDDESEGEADAYLAVDDDEDISELSAEQLQLLVHTLSGQLKKTTKPATCTASARTC